MRAVPIAILAATTLLAGCEADLIRPRPGAPNHSESATVPTPLDEANVISASVRARHMPGPMNIIVDPQHLSGVEGTPEYHTVKWYRHLGDAAIWTGHYLAAESFRYAATGGDADALAAVDRALSGIEMLVKVTSTNQSGAAQKPRLARFFMPEFPDGGWTQEYIDGAYTHEKPSAYFGSVVDGKPYKWMANVSRDQYSGAFFGLSVAYDLVPATRTRVANVVTQLLDYLISTGWSIRNPDGKTSTTFFGRADQQLSFLQVGRQVNFAKFDGPYRSKRATSHSSVKTPISLECSDTHGGYYKFNLNHINLYNLVRLEEAGTPRNSYVSAFTTLRNCTGSHRNAHFSAIDRAIRGGSTDDVATYLAEWRTRGRRDQPVNLNGKYAACGTDRACSPVPIPDRPNTDFLWQRSPFSLVGTGEGTIETAAIDYLLPYWMSQYCGLAAGARNAKVCI